MLSSQKLPPIKTEIQLKKQNISTQRLTQSIKFPDLEELKKSKKKIEPITKKKVEEKSKNKNIILTTPNRKKKIELKTIDFNTSRAQYISKSVDKNLIKNLIIEEEEKKNIFKVVKNGNDNSTILKCFEHRINWKNESECKGDQSHKINFFWAPCTSQIDFSYLIENKTKIKTMCNHFPNQNQLSNKLNIFKNLLAYCEENKLDLFKYIPVTIIIQYDSPFFLGQISNFEDFFNSIKDFVLDPYKPKALKDWKRKYRYFFYTDGELDSKIGRKTNLFIPKNHYDGKNLWIIKALNLNRGLAIKIIDSIRECKHIIKNYYQGRIIKCVKNYHTNGNSPDANDETKNKDNIEEEEENVNKKIYFRLPKIVTTTKNGQKRLNFKNDHDFCLYRQIDYYSLLKKSKEEKKTHYQCGKIILQKYIEKPLLYNGRKFDMRTWVLLTHDRKIYLFKEGHLKATSCSYDVNNKDPFVHLTNYSVQKYSQNFSNYEIGNEISYDQIQESLSLNYGINIDVRKEIINKISEIILWSFNSVKKKINTLGVKGCFELFGFDFMFDADLNPFLIEINTNPGLEISSPLISKLVPRMIDDAFRLTIDKVFKTKYSEERYRHNKEKKIDEYISPFHVDGYDDSENIFKLLGTLRKY